MYTVESLKATALAACPPDTVQFRSHRAAHGVAVVVGTTLNLYCEVADSSGRIVWHANGKIVDEGWVARMLSDPKLTATTNFTPG
jgi:hypothetical protein